VGSTFVPDEPRRFACENFSDGTCLRRALVVQRFLADGSADMQFAGSGTVITDSDPPYGAQDTTFGALALAPQGRITAAGSVCSEPFLCDLVVARYGNAPAGVVP